MILKRRLLFLLVSLGLALNGSALAAPGNKKAVPPIKKANTKTVPGAQDKNACKALNSQAKELLAQEKQLHEQAKEKGFCTRICRNV